MDILTILAEQLMENYSQEETKVIYSFSKNAKYLL
jgi:hypothetical protein